MGNSVSPRRAGAEPTPIAMAARPAPRTTLLGLSVVAVVVLLAGACAKDTGTATGPVTSGVTAGSVPGTVPAAPVNYSKPGPYPVGMQRLTMGATKVVVFYPATKDGLDKLTHVTSYSSGEAFDATLRQTVAGLVPEFVQDIPIDAYQDAPINAEGPFPVVIHSHGFGGFYLFASQHFEQEASWGFVVAAPDHISRDLTAAAGGKIVTDGDPDVTDLTNTLDLLTQQNASATSPLKGGLDTQVVGAEGHSAGGRASYLFAAKTPQVKAWIGQAPSAPVRFDRSDTTLSAEEQLAKRKELLAAAPVLGKPSMIVAGEKDSVIPLPGIQAQYDWMQPPKRMMVVKNSGHAGFLDVCKPIRAQGGLQKYSDKLPTFAPLFKLGDDGCGADNVDPVLAYAFINHVMIAQYRYVFGEDTSDVSLGKAYLEKTFPEAFGAEQSQQ